MKIRVRYFAQLREALGTAEETVETGAADVAALRLQLLARGGAYAEALADGRAVRCALNQQLCTGQARLANDDEVAFFPPVTGG
jgi:molybdopterin synthase sulfur carrier subunit